MREHTYPDRFHRDHRGELAPVQPLAAVLVLTRRLRLITSLILLPLGLGLAGCASSSGLRRLSAAAYEPANIHRAEASLPDQIKRVALLPVTALSDEPGMDFGRESLGPILANELGRVRLFELVLVGPEELRALTGRPAWTGEEQLPLDFFEKLKDKLGVDAVLFSRLTQYRPYEPLSVGWRLKLVDADDPHLLWAVDEVFDAGTASVATAARRFARSQPGAPGTASEVDDILASPRRFGQYTAHALFATLPGRNTRDAEKRVAVSP